MPLPTAIMLPALFAIGVAFGSFLTMLIPRIKKNEKGIFFGRSHCRSCKKNLKAHDLIPIFSFLKNKGKCRFCKETISAIYPVTEIITGITFMAVYLFFPFGGLEETLVSLFYMLMALILLFTFFYDLKYLEISDRILLPGIALAILGAIFFDATPGIVSALIGMAIGAGFFLIQILVSKGKWVGGGDLRIGAFMGALLGWQCTLVALVVSYLLGSIISIPLLASGNKKMGAQIPLGPFLVLGTFVGLFFGREICFWYINMM